MLIEVFKIILSYVLPLFDGLGKLEVHDDALLNALSICMFFIIADLFMIYFTSCFGQLESYLAGHIACQLA